VLLALYHDHPAGASQSCYQRFRSEKVFERLRAIDERARREGLGALDPASDPLIPIGMEVDSSGRATKNCYGVFNLSWQAQMHPEWPSRVQAEVDGIRGQIKQAHQAPLRYLIWAGMGGSIEDKCAYHATGLLARGPRCYALDSTDPAKLKHILADMESRSPASLPALLRSTLVVGMAMGMTSYEPVVNLEKLSALYDHHKIDGRANFLYMTLPGSLLEQFAGPRGYRKVELQPDGANSTAGRHSGPLTRGSLYPLALAGVDLRAWMEATFLSPAEIETAWELASFIHAQGEAGRDKLTLLLPKTWAGAAPWTKQDFEESLGKREDLGLKVVIDERLRLANFRSPRDARQDRAFLSVQFKSAPSPDKQKVALLRRAGYPLAVLTLPAGTPLSRYMQFVHYVVFGIGYLRSMNFVTQPSVELYKIIANELHAEARKAGGIEKTVSWTSLQQSRKAKWRGGITLYHGGMDLKTGQTDAARIYGAILKELATSRRVEYAELTFFGDTRYNPAGRRIRRSLNRAAERLFRSRLKMPVDVHEGPAMNHSYHEMIIGHGKCFSTVLLSEKQERIPALQYAPEYHMAQFLATKMALERRNRPVVAITIRDLSESSLAALDEFFQQAASALKP
jgi:glucose-6-phosphate isomerase